MTLVDAEGSESMVPGELVRLCDYPGRGVGNALEI
jgi:hypothetical protein